MASPSKPFDALSLLFECAKHGSIETCSVYLPAGHNLRQAYGAERAMDPATSGKWYDVLCLRVHTAGGDWVHGEGAALAIASQNLAARYVAQITRVEPATNRACECLRCARKRDLSALPKLLGEHPSTED